MRRTLLVSTAIIAWSAAAAAETVIDAKRTTPANTATIKAGAPDSIRIASAGSVELTSGTAVTMDSNHAVTVEGKIVVTNAAGGTGIVANAGTSGDIVVTSTGSITVDVEVVGSTEELIAREMDIYSPNALGHALTPEVARRLRVAAVCGAANNQLSSPEVASMLAGRGILYAPDYLVNCGGVVQAAEEVPGFDMDRARARVAGVYDTTLRVLGRAEAEGVLPVVAAAREAEERMTAGGPAFELFDVGR